MRWLLDLRYLLAVDAVYQAYLDPVDLTFKQHVLRELGMAEVLINAAVRVSSVQGALDCCHSILYFSVKVPRRLGPDVVLFTVWLPS